MNIFRLAGDMTHLASVLVLLLKIHTIKSCAGVSLRTQELYAIVFATRYLDIFTSFVSVYNTFMKLVFLGSSFSIVWYMRYHKAVHRTYDREQDTFRHWFLVLPCLVLALLIHEKFTFLEVLWTFSLYLEAVAILPQLVLLQRTRNIDNLTGQYIFLLGGYRGLYILNWIYRYFTEPHFVHWIIALWLWITMVDARFIGGRGVEKYVTFGQNYVVKWGQGHISTLHSGKEVDLYMDQSSGAGFESKNIYGSGLFQMRIKVPGGNSGGVLTSLGSNHDEIDFEFLGNNDGKPITLQTNIFANGEGNREERFLLWFNPIKHYHTYGILWNPYQIVFYVDNIPIRVYKNQNGVNYPSKPMQVEASLWNGDAWATDGGRTKINYAYSPFIAHFQDFSGLSGCYIDGRSDNVATCGSSNYWWNGGKYQRLSGYEQKIYEHIRKKYMNYDYCTDRSKYQSPPRECY
ncbi:hypothetical protein HID58_025279 [Brassica napus]|uniref:ER lumen protein-retaining receptor n=1 Tax=Brassica napus TaxID=3708 RepID=A0ABQ8CKL8_BRANA|nr:hypothetical protein HID58_025279 [Brassica napus]